MKKLDYVSHDGRSIRLWAWDEVEAPKGVIQIIHGMAEHGARYDHTAKAFNKAGYIVYADDHRAHGDTVGDGKLGADKGDIFEDTLLDELHISRFLKDKYQLPLVVLGHSYGSFLAQAYMERDNVADKIILSGSAKNPAYLTIAGKIMADITSLFKGRDADGKMIANISFDGYDKHFGEGHNAWLSVDKQNRENYKNDPYCGYIMSAGFYSSFFKGIAKLYSKSNLALIDKSKPVFIISGADDPVGGYSAFVQDLYKTYQRAGLNVSLKLYEGLRHEILNEATHDVVEGDILAFIK